MNNSVLIINYYWPPAGGSAVQRWVNILNIWTGSGISCHVVTIDEHKASYQAIDTSLAKKVDSRINTCKTSSTELFHLYRKFIGPVPANAFVNEEAPSFIQKIARFIRGNFFIPDPRKGWNKFAYIKAKEVIKNHSIKYVFTAGPPHSTHLIGLKLKKSLDIKWIADFHDYWSDVFYLEGFYRTLPAKWIDRCLEKKVIKKADLVMSHCQYAKKLYEKRVNHTFVNKIIVHTMGYDELLFSSLKPTKQQTSFIITYAGMMPENYHMEFFFKILRRIVERYPEIPVKIRFIGIISKVIKQHVKKYELENYFEETGYVEHKKIPDLLNNSTVLLLANPDVKNDEMIVPGKIYEYLAARKPVISISSKNSENSYLLNLCDAGKNFERNDEEVLFQYITELIEKWKEFGNVDIRHSNENYKKFSRRYEAMNLLKKINSLT